MSSRVTPKLKLTAIAAPITAPQVPADVHPTPPVRPTLDLQTSRATGSSA